MNIVYFLLFVGSVALAAFSLVTLFKKANIVLAALLGTVLFFAVYTLFSSLLLAVDKFYVSYALVATLAAFAAFFLLRVKHLKESWKNVEWNPGREVIIALLIVLVCAMFTWAKSENIAPNHDAGVYGQKAIDMMYGGNGSVTGVEEYNAAGNEAVRESVLEHHRIQSALYIDKTNMPEELAFQYHAFPAWPATLALWGTMFGTFNMGGVLTLLFACAALGVFFITRAFAKNKFAPFLALLLFAFCPLAVNVAKNFLSETIYTVFVVGGLLLLCQKGRGLKWLAALPLCALPFLHLSTMAYAPMFFLLFLFLDVRQKETVYSTVGMLFNAALALSYPYAMSVSGIYSAHQIGKMFKSFEGFGVSAGTAFMGVAGVLFAIQLVWVLVRRKREGRLQTALDGFLQKRFLLVLRVLLVAILAVCAVKAYWLCFTDHYQQGLSVTTTMQYRTYGGSGLNALKYLNFTQAVLYGSFVCVPYLIYKLFSKKTKWGVPEYAMAFVFLYALAVATIYRTDTPVLYYFARYQVVVLLPAMAALTGMLIENKKLIALFMAVCVLFSLPFNMAQWDVRDRSGDLRRVDKVMEAVPPGSVVVLRENAALAGLLPENLRQMNNNLVYSEDVVNQVVAMYPDKEIYYVSNALEDDESYQLLSADGVESSDFMFSFSGMYPMSEYQWDETISVYRVAPGARVALPSAANMVVTPQGGDLYTVRAEVGFGTRRPDTVIVGNGREGDPAVQQYVELEQGEDGAWYGDVDMSRYAEERGGNYYFNLFARTPSQAVYELGTVTMAQDATQPAALYAVEAPVAQPETETPEAEETLPEAA